MTSKEYEENAKQSIIKDLKEAGFIAAWNIVSDDIQYVDTDARVKDIIELFAQVKIIDEYRCIVIDSREDGMQDVYMRVLCEGQWF